MHDRIRTGIRKVLILFAASLPLIAAAQAPGYPDKPITLVVSNAPGGSSDVFARALGQRLQAVWGQNVIVDDHASDGSVLADSFVTRVKPNGYTLFVVSSTFTIGAAIRTRLQYDAEKDFTPVAMIARGPLLVTVSDDSPFKTIEELIVKAKAEPGKLRYGSSGASSINQFATELLAESAGIKLTHIPYKSMSTAVDGLLGGQIDLLVASAPSILQQVKSGRARALAVTAAKRSALVPDLPTLEEIGYHHTAIDLWWGVLAPASTPAPVVDKLNAAINREIRSPEMQAIIQSQGAEPAPIKPAEFVRYIGTEVDRWKDVAKKSGIQPD